MTILLIDDQPGILSALVTGIHWYEMGFTTVLTASSAAKARRILTESLVDIVVSDIEMPNEDGLSLLSWARQEGLNYECILLTAHADFYYAKQAISLNVFDYVVQPARFEDIALSVKKAVERIRGNQQHTKANQQMSVAANNIVINSLLDSWPNFESTLIYPQELEQRLRQLRQFGIACSENSPCLLLSVSCKTPGIYSTDIFRSACSSFYTRICRKYDIPGISCYTSDQRFLAVLFMPLPPSPERTFVDLWANSTAKASIDAQLDCTAAEIRFLKNALDFLCGKGAAASSQERFRYFCFDQEPFLSSITGRNHYLHYSRLIRSYIHKHMAEPISRQDIADNLHLSPDHVSFVVKNTENMTVKELINSVKMEHARRMLLNTKMSIGEIAQKCGYDSFAYFSKLYRETYHITPSQERAKS